MWLYKEAQLVDPWPETPPEEGTSEQAAAQILITKGHRRVFRGSTWLPALSDGIEAVRFANPGNIIDEYRSALSLGIPVGLAFPWFTNFDNPKWTGSRGWVIGDGNDPLGSLRGWHFVCGFGARDKYEAGDIVNNWGYDYPIVKMPYRTMERMADQGGTFAIITDR
jgi:hypothetical protein